MGGEGAWDHINSWLHHASNWTCAPMSCGRWNAFVTTLVSPPLTSGCSRVRATAAPISKSTTSAWRMLQTDLRVDVTVRHNFKGTGHHGQTRGQLRNSDNPDHILESPAADKIRNYRDTYRRNRHVAFLPACLPALRSCLRAVEWTGLYGAEQSAVASEQVVHTEQIDPVHSHPADGGILGDLKDLSHLLCVGDIWICSMRMLFLYVRGECYFLLRNNSDMFRAASNQSLKSKVGLAAAKAAALRINLSIGGCDVVAPLMHTPFALPFSPPSFFHTISPSPAFTSA